MHEEERYIQKEIKEIALQSLGEYLSVHAYRIATQGTWNEETQSLELT